MSAGGRVWLDRSPGLILACCSVCAPCWRTEAGSTVDGWQLLAVHAASCHRAGEQNLSHIARRNGTDAKKRRTPA